MRRWLRRQEAIDRAAVEAAIGHRWNQAYHLGRAHAWSEMLTRLASPRRLPRSITPVPERKAVH